MSSILNVFSKYLLLTTEDSFQCHKVGNVSALQICRCVYEFVVVFLMLRSSRTTYIIIIIEIVT
jgi:hypothetical protein